MVETEPHVDNARDQHRGDDPVDEKVFLQCQETGRIYSENSDEEDGLGAEGNEEGETYHGLDEVDVAWTSDKGVFLPYVSTKDRCKANKPLTTFVRFTPPKAKPQAIAHAFRMKMGFFHRCELVKTRAMLMGTSAPSQSVLRIMSFSWPVNAPLENCASWAGGPEAVPFTELHEEFIARVYEIRVVDGVVAVEINIAKLIYARPL